MPAKKKMTSKTLGKYLSEIPDDMPIFAVDKSGVQVELLNVKASSDEGSVTIELDEVFVPPDYVVLSPADLPDEAKRLDGLRNEALARSIASAEGELLTDTATITARAEEFFTFLKGEG